MHTTHNSFLPCNLWMHLYSFSLSSCFVLFFPWGGHNTLTFKNRKIKALKMIYLINFHSLAFCPVQEVPNPALHRCGDHPREQLKSDFRPTWNNSWESNRRNVSHRSPHPHGRHCLTQIWWFSNRLWLICSASHPREQSVSTVTVNHVLPPPRGIHTLCA